MKNNQAAVAALNEHLAYLLSLVNGSHIQEFSRGVADFHLLLVRLAGNQTLAFINQIVLDLMVNHKADVVRRDPIDPETRKKRLLGGMKSYHKLIQLIEAREEEAAVAHWRLHLKNAHARWAGPGEGERIVDSLNV